MRWWRGASEAPAWWAVAADPVAGWLARLLDRRTVATPGQVGGVAGMLSVAAAGAFLVGERRFVAAGALVFVLALLLERTRDRLARIVLRETALAGWAAALIARGRFVACGPVVLLGRFSDTGDLAYLYLAVLVAAAGAFCEVNGVARRRPVTEAEVALAAGAAGPLTGATVPVVLAAVGLLLVSEGLRLPKGLLYARTAR